MAEQKRTQKQVAEKYKDNLTYYRKLHPFRALRLVVFLLTVVATFAVVFTYARWGKPQFYNTGPISQHHARFDCADCHDAKTDLTDAAKQLPDAAKFTLAAFSSTEKLRDGVQTALAETALSKMDAACLKCHDAFQLHMPQAEQLRLKSVSKELALVHSNNCSSCHREHTGHGPMPKADSLSCNTCHNSKDALASTLNIVKTNAANAPDKPAVRDLGDKIRRFIVPTKPGQSPAFASYAEGHPPFLYERPEARDPGVLRFNHARHFQQDIPKIDGRTMTCADCHKAADGGVHFQRISFEQHCQRCHSLQLDPEIREIQIPHGSAEDVRFFLSNLTAQYKKHAAEKRGISDPVQQAVFVKERFDRLMSMGMTSGEEIAKRVFWTGEPAIVRDRRSPKPNKAQTLYSCQLCHDYRPDELTETPTSPAAVASAVSRLSIAPTNLPDRWVHHGPFTHATHTHMACTDCHGAALKSQLTSDILLPAQKSCTECHRPLERDKVKSLPATTDEAAAKLARVEKEKREGGVKADCLDCHSFHSPKEALQFLEVKK